MNFIMKEVAGEVELLTGHSTPDALRILHSELLDITLTYENRQYLLGPKKRNFFLHPDNLVSPLHWTSFIVIVVFAIFLLIAYAASDHRDSWLVVEALVLMILLVINCYFLGWDDQLRATEITQRMRRVFSIIEDCTKETLWSATNYVNQHAPLSPCVSLQWTYRDGEVVNLPQSFLVEGDIILLRPGQEVPAKCRQFLLEADDFDECIEYEKGDIYNPDLQHKPHIAEPQARSPLKPATFIMLETPFVQNIRLMLETAENRPVSMLNNERFNVYNQLIERKLLPAYLVIFLLTNALRFFLTKSSVGDWTDMLIVQQIHGLLPMTAVVFPLLWKLMDIYGIAKVMVLFNKAKVQSRLKSSIEEFDSDGNLEHLKVTHDWSYQEIWNQCKLVLIGQADTLPRTSNVVHSLGNVTSFCCVDKKGILSWPNPTAEKVFFLRNDSGSLETSSHSSQYDSAQSMTHGNTSTDSSLDNDEMKSACSSKNDMHDHDYFAETHFEVLDLTPDAKNGNGLQFDDPSWKRFINSLKPLGLNILMNTCNLSTVEQYTLFADHVTCMSLKREIAVPVVNRRCFCELAHQIGFCEKALDIFQTHQSLGMYRDMPPDSNLKDKYFRSHKSFMRLKMPMPNVFSVVAKEKISGMLQLMSQGTADLILNICSDYWNGRDLCQLTEANRKKILDFYHRTSMASYCTAFSYCPLTQPIGEEFSHVYTEVPDLYDDLHCNVRSPSPTRSWENSNRNSGLMKKKHYYHGSLDSLITGTDVKSVHDVEEAFKSQCNQIFIGLITMQYQAKQDIVNLIEELDSSCIRFVHFSKENELRSRVFSEKMGLEAGWNCHISLLSEKMTEANSGIAPTSHSNVQSNASGRSSKYSRHSTESLHNHMPSHLTTARLKTLPEKNRRRCSAPGAISVDMVQVKFEASSTIEESLSSIMTSKHTSPKGNVFTVDDLEMGHDGVNQRSDEHQQNEVTNKLTDKCFISETYRHSTSTQEHNTGVGRGSHDFDPLIEQGVSDLVTSPSDIDHSELTELKPGEMNNIYRSMGQDENLSSSESYPASSYVTENTDSVMGGFGLSNRAKLPKGIENIRPHISYVDNVPLLVSLFTDCTPETTTEMLKILQENGEVVCVLGSSANIANTPIFLQADCSLAVEPMYPQVCTKQPVIHRPWRDDVPTPVELSGLMHSIPCALSFQRDDHISITSLIAQARHHCQGVRNMFLLLVMFQFTLVLLQLLDTLLQLPPILATHHVLWLVTVSLPALATTIIGNPCDPAIMEMALGKNRSHVKKQAVLEFALYYCVSFLLTVLVCLLCFGLNMNVFCNKVVQFHQKNTSCHVLYGQIDYGKPGTWNGWLTEYSAGLVIAQNFAACQLLIYCVCVSLCYVHRCHHLWQKSPFINKIWCIIVPIMLFLQVLYFIIDVIVHNQQSVILFSVGDVALASWILAFIWPTILIPILELVKRREIKLSVRFQKRARLDFDTKLGMNSPF